MRHIGRQVTIPPAGGMYKAKLAEDYDGIGQYVLVSLSGTSTGAAYKARVAAGDFGGSRVFPIGTPVVVHSFRGLLEVFLGNQPKQLYFDDFNRCLGSSWDSPTGNVNTEGFVWDTSIVDAVPVPVEVDCEHGWLRSTTNTTHATISAEGPWSQPHIMEVTFFVDVWNSSPVVFPFGANLTISDASFYNLQFFQNLVRLPAWNATYDAVYNFQNGVTYKAKLDLYFTDSQTVKVKIWPADEGEPGEYLIDQVDGPGAQFDDFFEFAMFRANGWVDNLKFTPPWVPPA